MARYLEPVFPEFDRLHLIQNRYEVRNKTLPEMVYVVAKDNNKVEIIECGTGLPLVEMNLKRIGPLRDVKVKDVTVGTTCSLAHHYFAGTNKEIFEQLAHWCFPNVKKVSVLK